MRARSFGGWSYVFVLFVFGRIRVGEATVSQCRLSSERARSFGFLFVCLFVLRRIWWVRLPYLNADSEACLIVVLGVWGLCLLWGGFGWEKRTL